MNQITRINRFARMALFFFILLMAACATMDVPQDSGHAVPQAPGVGLEGDAPAAPAQPVATASTPGQPSTPAIEPAASSSHAPVASRIRHNHNYVNVRSEPSTDHKPVAVLSAGKRVEVIGEQGNWVKVRWKRGKKELEGWVYKTFVEAAE